MIFLFKLKTILESMINCSKFYTGLSVVPFTIQEGDNIYQGHIDLQSLLQMESDNGFRQIILDNLKAVGVQPSKGNAMKPLNSNFMVLLLH